MRTPKFANAVVERIEGADVLDKPAGVLAGLIGKVVRPGPVEDVLSGVPSGHPLHPALVAVPIGAWASAGLLDAVGEDDAARTLVGLGLLSALPAMASGGSDWAYTEGAERRVGFVHALTNYVALGAYGLSWWARRRGSRHVGVCLSAAGAAAVGAAGWLGGHLSYAQGVGVDTTAFQRLPSDWADLAAAADVPAEGTMGVHDVDGVPVLLARHHGELFAIADRCTHRGAPLHEGEIHDGCVVCPWHGSVFDVADGSVQSGPAVRPQPTLETRVHEGRIEVRRQEQRTLRTNPTGV